MDHHNRPTHVYLIAGYLTSHGVYNTELTCSINTVEDCTATIISYLFSFALRSSSTLINIHRFEAALAGWTIDIQLLQPMLFASTSITEVQIFFHFPPPEYQFVCLIFFSEELHYLFVYLFFRVFFKIVRVFIIVFFLVQCGKGCWPFLEFFVKIIFVIRLFKVVWIFVNIVILLRMIGLFNK